jgi:hypothetical protein
MSPTNSKLIVAVLHNSAVFLILTGVVFVQDWIFTMVYHRGVQASDEVNKTQ